MLAQFTGLERFYRYTMVRDVVFTEGVNYIAGPKLRNQDLQN